MVVVREAVVVDLEAVRDLSARAERTLRKVYRPNPEILRAGEAPTSGDAGRRDPRTSHRSPPGLRRRRRARAVPPNALLMVEVTMISECGAA